MPPPALHPQGYTQRPKPEQIESLLFPSSEQRTSIRLSTREATFIAERFIHLIKTAVTVRWRFGCCLAPVARPLAYLINQPTLYQCLRKSPLELGPHKKPPLLPLPQALRTAKYVATLNESAAAIYLQGVGCLPSPYLRASVGKQGRGAVPSLPMSWVTAKLLVPATISTWVLRECMQISCFLCPKHV